MFLLSDKTQNKGVVMSVRTKGGKVVRKAKVIPIEVTMAVAHRGPNMSRKNSGTRLYPFPSFDKCDSLLFFPTTFTSCLNSGDYVSLGKLIRSRIDGDCEMRVAGQKMDVDMCVGAFEISHEAHPDTICAVHSTKVVGNQIRSFMYFKYTENKSLRLALERSSRDTTMLKYCPTPQSNTEALFSFLATKSPEEREMLQVLVDSAEEIVVYGTSLLTLTFEDFTKKITHFDMQCEFTSFSACP